MFKLENMAKICVFQIVLTCTLILIPSSIRIWAKEVIDNDIRNKRILLNSAEDIVSEIMNLKSEIEHLKKELQSNTGKYKIAHYLYAITCV